jgi:hypothetical protein
MARPSSSVTRDHGSFAFEVFHSGRRRASTRADYSSVINVMYASPVKRLQIMIEEDLDAELDRIAHREHTSKAALIRRFVREQVRPLPPLTADPIGRMTGSDDFDPAPIDEVVYR